MTLGRIALLFFIVLFATDLSAQKKSKSKSLFTVDNKAVSAEEFIYLYTKNHQNRPEEFTKEKIEEYLNLFINFKLKVTEAQARGYDTTRAFKKEFNSYRDELRKPYLPDSKLLDSLVAVTYERMKEEVNASHILVNIKSSAPADTLEAYNKILALRDRVVNGEDINTLAQSVSDDPSSKMNQGKLGYFSALQMVYPFETAAFTTKPGDVSKPVRSQFGYHILKIHDRRPSRGEVEVSHILIRTGEAKDNAKSKDLIFDIYDQLQHGASWTELCKQYSEDPSSKENGGKIRPFGTGVMSGFPGFEEAAFGLQKPGEISDPFETQYGWHILRLERKIPLQSFKEIAGPLRNKVARDERVQVSKQALYLKLRKQYNFSENIEVKNRVFSMADSSLTKGKWKPVWADKKSYLFSYGKEKDLKTIPASSFFDFVQERQRPNRSSPSKYLEQLYDNFVEQELLKQVEDKTAASSPEYRWLLNEYFEGILLFEIMEKEVWNKASQDSVGQLKYYEANKNDYKAGERIKADIYSATTKSHIQQIKDLIDQGAAEKVSELVTSLKIKKETGIFEKADRQVFNKIDWKPGSYLASNNDLHYTVVLKEIVPPGVKSFSEARAEVISDYQNALEKEWVASLRKKYPVSVNKETKEAVVKKLIESQTPTQK